MVLRMLPIGILGLAAAFCGCNWFTGDPASQAGDGSGGNDAEVDPDWDPSDSPPMNVNRTDASGSAGSQRAAPDPYYIVGETLPDWDVAAWANTESLNIDPPITLEKLRGQVVVVRFWTDGSEACARTLPAMQQLAEEFRGQPVVLVGIYFNSGSFADDPWADAQARARHWGVTFPIAADHRTLQLWWLNRYDNLPLTPTFVIGPEGHVVYLHPGPEFYPSDQIDERLCNQDFQQLRAVIANTLSRQVADSGHER